MTLPPLKTALGQQELRARTRKLGQRHRTVLLLVDGKRSHAEVLALAGQAGVAASYFDALVEMGLIEWAAAPAAPAAEAIEATAVASVEAGSPPTDAVGIQATHEAATTVTPPVSGDDAAAAAAETPPPIASTSGGSATGLTAAAAVPLPQPAVPAAAPPAFAAAPSGAFAPPGREPAPFAAPAGAEDPELARARGLLIGTLSDGTARSERTLRKVRVAGDRESLIELVWQIDRSLGRGRQAVEARRSLARVRELLGLGNTVVHEDSRPREDA